MKPLSKRTDASKEEAIVENRPSGWAGTFESFRYRDFRLLWTGTTLLAGGIWLMQVTLGWLAYEMTQSALQVGIILGLRAGPLLLAPVTGALADRMDRRKLLLFDQAYVSAVVIVFAIDLLLGMEQVWHLYVFALMFGLGWAINNPVRQMLVATSVPRESLANAVALMAIAFNSMRAIGPAIGGFFIAFFGPGLNFLLMGILFLLVFLLVLPYRVRYGTTDRTVARGQSISRNLIEGFRYVSHQPITLAAMAVTFALTLTMMALVFNLLPVYAAEVLPGESEVVLGLLMMSLGIGGVTGTIFMARFSRVSRKGLVAIVTFAATGLTVVALSQVSVLWMAMVVLGLHQAFIQGVMTSNHTIVQTMTPDHMRGRVTGVYQMEIGMMPIGGIVAGAIADAFGVQTAFAVGAIAGLAAIVVLAVVFPRYRRLDL